MRNIFLKLVIVGVLMSIATKEQEENGGKDYSHSGDSQNIRL